MKQPDRESHDFMKRVALAMSGIKLAFLQEKNLKIQTAIGVIVIILAVIVQVSLTDLAIILLLIGGVLSLELINTAIERTVDLATQSDHPLAKAAKDIAAGAVLTFSFFSVIIGIIILLKQIS